jgi:8-oxo-dGTP pyrophosphatase MutT (NUDIX family)
LKFCGGRVNDEEFNLKETAKREVKEEMGLDIEILDDEPYFFYTEKEKEGLKISVVLVHFLARMVGDIMPGEGITEWCWLDINDLDKENLAPNIRPTLKYFGF